MALFQYGAGANSALENHMPDPTVFESEYYQKLHDFEKNFWWAKGTRKNMYHLLKEVLAESKHPLKILDAGCGTGFLLKYLKKNFSPKMDVVGFDISPHALKYCQQLGEKMIIVASAVNPPLAYDLFDLIVCIDTLQHLSPLGGDQKALKAFFRMLRPGGILYIRTNSALGHVPLRGVDPNNYRRYRRPELISQIQDSGLKVERATYENFVMSFWGMLKEYLNFDRKLSDSMGPGLSMRFPRSKWVNSMLYKLLQIEAWIISRLGIDFPFGHSQIIVARKPESE